MEKKMHRKQKNTGLILLTVLLILFPAILNAEFHSKIVSQKDNKNLKIEIFLEDNKEIARFYYDKEGVVIKKEGKMPDMTFNSVSYTHLRAHET